MPSIIQYDGEKVLIHSVAANIYNYFKIENLPEFNDWTFEFFFKIDKEDTERRSEVDQTALQQNILRTSYYNFVDSIGTINNSPLSILEKTDPDGLTKNTLFLSTAIKTYGSEEKYIYSVVFNFYAKSETIN